MRAKLSKKKKCIIICLVIIVFLLAISTVIFCLVSRNAVKENELKNAQVSVFDNNALNMKLLDEQDAQTIIEMLYATTFSGFGTKMYRYYTGSSAPMFRISKNDGTVIELSAGSPFIIINGWGYRIDYVQAEKIEQIYRNLCKVYLA